MSVNSEYSSNTYREAANAYIQYIQQHSLAAADCIEQIDARFGTRAAYLAAFALSFLKQRQSHQSYPASQSDLHAFTYCEEMLDSSEAIQLYEQAAIHLQLGGNETD